MVSFPLRKTKIVFRWWLVISDELEFVTMFTSAKPRHKNLMATSLTLDIGPSFDIGPKEQTEEKVTQNTGIPFKNKFNNLNHVRFWTVEVN